MNDKLPAIILAPALVFLSYSVASWLGAGPQQYLFWAQVVFDAYLLGVIVAEITLILIFKDSSSWIPFLSWGLIPAAIYVNISVAIKVARRRYLARRTRNK
jgi:hypothetical protein